MANSILQQAQQLKMMIDHAKQQSVNSKEMAVQSVRQEMEKVCFPKLIYIRCRPMNLRT